MDEFQQGIANGWYVKLGEAWCSPDLWHGNLVAFLTNGKRCGLLTSGNCWRCRMGVKEESGQYGQTWWEFYWDPIVSDRDEGIAMILKYLDEEESENQLVDGTA